MERKEILIVVAVCAAVCLLIAGMRSVFGAPEDSSDTDSVLQTTPSFLTSSTDYWDKIRQETETTAAATDENGNPVVTDGTADATAPVTDAAGENTVPSDTVPALPDVTAEQTSDIYAPVIDSGSNAQSNVQTEPTSAAVQSSSRYVIHVE